MKTKTRKMVLKPIALFVLCIFVNFLNAQEILFEQHVVTSSFTDGFDVCASDIDQDGHQDILACGKANGGEVCWWKNNGNNTFTKISLKQNFAGARSIRAADINNDQEIDIVSAGIQANKIIYFENDGDENFTEFIVDDSFIGAHTVDIKDVNNDGHLDILCSGFDYNGHNGEIAWWENDGQDPVAWTKHLISDRFKQSPFIFGEDMDNDNDIDVIACGELNDEILWWENDGSGVFISENMVDPNFDAAHTVLARDVDLDGDMDILGAAYYSNKLVWYENDGSQQFLKHDLQGVAGALWLDAIDLDNDGDNDLIAAGMNSSYLYWYENNGSQGFTRYPIDGGFSQGFSIVTVNMDNDSDLDLLAIGKGSDKISWFENDLDSPIGLQDDYLGYPKPGSIPEIFAPDFISTEYAEFAGTFTPDFTEYYFTRRGPFPNGIAQIMVTKETDDSWSTPVVADFSSNNYEFEPFVTPDGMTLYFGSRRSPDGVLPPGEMHQWYLEKGNSDWSEPALLGSPFYEIMVMYPSVSNSKTFYFTGFDGIYYSKLLNDVYQEPIKLGTEINFLLLTAHSFIAPDESYLLFDGQPRGEGMSDIYISYKKEDGTWTKGKFMGKEINSGESQAIASVSPDGECLFFTRNLDIYWVDAAIIDEIKLIPEITKNQKSGTIPYTVQFSADLTTVPDSIIAFEWDLDNDGVIDSELQNPEFTYTNAGTYSIMLKVYTSSESASKTFEDFVTITDPVLSIHYLGHSAFVLQFDNGISVVCDYGHFNAWVEYGWDSPIYDIGDLVPNVMTYSHYHEDHYDPDRIPDGVDYILSELDSLSIDGLVIKPIRVCEDNVNVEDNSAYLFTYKGLKFLHLGDAQAQIMNIENEEVQNHIKDIIPDSLDLLFMTIEGQQQFIEEAEIFVDLLKPKRIIPMHYWSTAYKMDFLSYLTTQDSLGSNYEIEETSGAKYNFYEDDFPAPVKVISLTRSAFTDITSIIENNISLDFDLNQNYPNPFNSSTTIGYMLLKKHRVNLIIYDILGNKITVLVDKEQGKGNYKVMFDSAGLANGIYFYQLTVGKSKQTKMMVLDQL